MIILQPKLHEQEGKKQLVVLPYKEIISNQEELADYEDLKELRKAKKTEKDAPIISLEDAKKELGL